jgi:steroid 5-alpha reductase family enzyme
VEVASGVEVNEAVRADPESTRYFVIKLFQELESFFIALVILISLLSTSGGNIFLSTLLVVIKQIEIVFKS